MPTTNGIRQDTPAAAPLSPEFLAGSTEDGLESLRTRLLDLTNRNRLLNFRHSSASSLRVVDVNLDEIFRSLVNGEKLEFVPVPEPDSQALIQRNGDAEAARSKPPAADQASLLGWRISYDLEDSETMEARSANVLPVLHYWEGLEALTRKIGSTAKTAIEESGTNILHLIFGFLEWYESDDSQLPRYAPLVALPVAMERSGGKGRGFKCSLEYSGEDLSTNLSLVEKMRRDFGFDIPDFEDEHTPEAYFTAFSHLLQQKKRWRIRRQITLSLLSFGKLLMYRDLDPNIWPGIAKHALVRELFEGIKNEAVSRAEEFLIDAPELKAEVPPVILDADSSQHSALIHALRGQNLVIEGPPGTGKSQTITNLIAAAMVKGKTVLFVAEKLAALEVVRRRLDEAGLGLFCLELHSHKGKKHEILNDIAQRLRAQGTFRDSRDLDHHLSISEDRKQRLARYAELINKPVESFETTVFEILWICDRCYRELPFTRELKGHVPDALTMTRAQFAEKEQFLSIYARQLTSVLGICPDLQAHPWAWVERALTLDEEERIVELLTEFFEEQEVARVAGKNLGQIANLGLDGTAEGFARARELVAQLPTADHSFNPRFLALCRDPHSRNILCDFTRDLERLTASLGILEKDISAPEQLLREGATAQLMTAYESIAECGLQELTPAELNDLLEGRKATEAMLSETEAALERLRAFLGCEASVSIRGISFLLQCTRLIESAPLEALHLRMPALESDGACEAIRNAAREARELRDCHEKLSANFDIQLATEIADHSKLGEFATRVTRAGLLQVLFGHGGYRQAVGMYRRISRSRRKRSRNDMARDLRSISEYIRARACFEGAPLYREVLGAHFTGIETNFEHFRVLASWYQEVFTFLPDDDADSSAFRNLLLRTRIERLRALRAGLPAHNKNRAQLQQVEELLVTFVKGISAHSRPPSESISKLLDWLREANGNLEVAMRALTAVGLRRGTPVSIIPGLVNAAKTYQEANATISSSNCVLRDLLGDLYTGPTTDRKPIEDVLSFAQTLYQTKLPTEAIDWILSEEYSRRLEQIRGLLSVVAVSGERLSDLSSDISALSGSDLLSDKGPRFQAVEQKAQAALANRDELSRWTHFVRLRLNSRETGLSKLTDLADSKTVAPEHLVPAFRFLFYNSLARALFAQYPELADFNGVTQEQVRKEFAVSDRHVIKLYRERAASVIDKRDVPYGNRSGPVGFWTELALIMHEINKQKRHIPIRQLVRRAGRALQGLKPCFMMGPLSVAQYLAPGELQFDLVVMDEASQLKPEDAIGAIARGGQIVIVGDPKQLPPTTFFERVALDAEDASEDSRTVAEEGESILDVASSLYQPVRRLRWHYRSRHHSLIAFSNREFYQGDLVIFPSAYHDHPSLGVRYHSASGMFENGRNAKEAAVVVEAVLQHMQNRPDESLGVVTLNREQSELIEELLDHRLRTDPFALAYQEQMNFGPEPFFVKNLENVQGDERDVIFISATYGPDSKGNQYQRFGPINSANGHRRLNVLFTRAKKRTEVFSSLDPDKIQTSASSAWGLRAFKQYLTFARTGILETPEEGCDQPTNDFERSVGALLKESGFDVVPQVGVAGFFIDLAVKHPTKAGAYLVGIECDGASYHSGRSARDRDRLRQEILESLGWRIYRIWSTDWFKSRNAEAKRLVQHLNDLLSTEPDHCS